jgi:hypothetical protein
MAVRLEVWCTSLALVDRRRLGGLSWNREEELPKLRDWRGCGGSREGIRTSDEAGGDASGY